LSGFRQDEGAEKKGADPPNWCLPRLEIADAAGASPTLDQKDLHTYEQSDNQNDPNFRRKQKTLVGFLMLCVVHRWMAL
jgi:hypothetical protein